MPMITDFVEDVATRQAVAIFTDINATDMLAFINGLLANPTYTYRTIGDYVLSSGELVVQYVLEEKAIP